MLQNDSDDDEDQKKEDGLTNLCEKYDIENDQWYKISSLPFSVRNASACALTSDSIYLFGGKCLLNEEFILSDSIW